MTQISKEKYNQDWMDKELAKQTLKDITGFSHEIWAVAQLLPNEGIEDGVKRIEALLVADKRELSQEEKDRIIDEYLDEVGLGSD